MRGRGDRLQLSGGTLGPQKPSMRDLIAADSAECGEVRVAVVSTLVSQNTFAAQSPYKTRPRNLTLLIPDFLTLLSLISLISQWLLELFVPGIVNGKATGGHREFPVVEIQTRKSSTPKS